MRALLFMLSALFAFNLMAAKWVEPVIDGAHFSLLRDSSDFTRLPRLKGENKTGIPLEIAYHAVLIDRNGRTVRENNGAITLPANGSATVEALCGELLEVADDILLLKIGLTHPVRGQQTVSGIFGRPEPVKRDSADVFGMNVHLGRYPAEVQWELLRLMKAAGVTAIREDVSFRSSDDAAGIARSFEKLEETLLGMEAFGMEGLAMIGYFPAGFHQSPEKLDMAYRWAKMLGERFKGRLSYHYGNETNSGWGAFGAAADMAPLNNAFALGTADADAGALRGSFGIAEGLENYVKAFVEAGTLPYLEAICVHPYCGTPEAGIAKSLATRKLIRNAGGSQQVWATEIGFHTDESGKINEKTGELTGVAGYSLKHQHQLLARLFTLAKSTGIERIYWYDFFGRNDPETFWLIDENYRPQPAYHVLAECARQLKGAESLGGTGCGELIQRHLFRKPDGSKLLVAWALADGVEPDFELPVSAVVADEFGKAVIGKLLLGHGVHYITGADFPEPVNERILVSALDKRNFNAPAHRFIVKAGESFDVPFVVFNSGSTPVEARSAALKTNPGWQIAHPASFAVAPGKTVAAAQRFTVPADAVPGVEYEFTLCARIGSLQRSASYTIRVKVEGDFPYRKMRESAVSGDYPMWNAMNENQTGFGNPELSAVYGKAAIDGNLADWDGAKFYPIDQKFQWKLRDPGQPGPSDWSGEVAFRWDEHYLYAAFLVEDDDISCLDFLSRDWRDSDNMRIFLSSVADHGKRSRRISANDILVITTPTDITRTLGPQLRVAPIGGFVRQNAEKEIRIAGKMWKNGYVLEVAIPFGLFNAKPEEGAILGLNVMADDVDGGFRQHSSMTFYRNDVYWNSPTSLGSLKLVK